MKELLSVTAVSAKLSSSSFSSVSSSISSGIENPGAASMFAEVAGRSSDKNFLRDSGDSSRDRMLPDGVTLRDSTNGSLTSTSTSSGSPKLDFRPRSESLSRNLNPKIRRAVPVQLGPGETERVDRLGRTEEADAMRNSRRLLGIGGGRGVVNLSTGSIVLYSVFRKEFIEALFSLVRRSTGTSSVFTVCPGRKGQAVVVGNEGL